MAALPIQHRAQPVTPHHQVSIPEIAVQKSPPRLARAITLQPAQAKLDRGMGFRVRIQTIALRPQRIAAVRNLLEKSQLGEIHRMQQRQSLTGLGGQTRARLGKFRIAQDLARHRLAVDEGAHVAVPHPVRRFVLEHRLRHRHTVRVRDAHHVELHARGEEGAVRLSRAFLARHQTAARGALDEIEDQRAVDSAQRRNDDILNPRHLAVAAADSLAQRLQFVDGTLFDGTSDGGCSRHA